MLLNKKRFPRKDESRNLIKWALACFVLIISAAITFINHYPITWLNVFQVLNMSDVSIKEYEYDMSVHFLDVGRADCIYIRFNKTNILIDSGDLLSLNVTNYLKGREIKKLDLVIATHPHRDHIGQMSEIINNFQIECFMMSETPKNITPTSHAYQEMLKSLRDKNVNVKVIKSDQIITFEEKDTGEKLTVHILSPTQQYENMNNNSIVAKMTYGSDKFLFMGDAEKDIEADLVERFDIKSDVLKVGHHGSKTSTSLEFLRAVNPTYAVISSGPDRFNLPKKEILDRINSFGIKILRTDFMGEITFFSNGNGVKFITQKEAS